MAERNGKAKDEGEERESSGFIPTMVLLRRDAALKGPWTDEDERHFQGMMEALYGKDAHLDR